ncbi:MAG: hypothetical protein LC112_07645 [Flavobacteriales bacterium]|nr:hypothetical protein [Flavobacteriales bacterium]
MSATKILKRLNEIGCFNPITLDIIGTGRLTATATFKTNPDAAIMRKINKSFSSKKYQYEIKIADQKLIIVIKKSILIRRLARPHHFDMADAMAMSMNHFDPAIRLRGFQQHPKKSTENPK